MLKINDLVGYKNRKIYQDSNCFCFSVDAVLLANFVTLNKSARRILDIGTGNAPIPLILTLRNTNVIIDAVEIQDKLARLALSSIKLNQLEKSVNIIHQDIRTFYLQKKANFYDIIVCNPPYFKFGVNDKVSLTKEKALARHEIEITLEDYFIVTKRLLKNFGIFAMIHRSERLDEVLELFKRYHIQPRRIQFIHSNQNKRSELFLIEGVKVGKVSLTIEKPFILYNDDNAYTDEYRCLLEEVL